MVTQLDKCPNCKTTITISGEPGEKIHLICPQCSQKGIFTLPGEKITGAIPSNSATIDVSGLTKTYNHFTAVDNVSFTVKKGEIFGFLGPNGAGKTTTIKILTTLIRPNQGTVSICGYDIIKNPIEVKKRIGFMPDVAGFYGDMTAEEILNFFAEFYRIPKVERRKKSDQLLDMMQLTDFKKKKVKTFSRGMKQKLGFASALLNDPEVLILDEPTVGLDPTTIHFFRELITSLNRKGVTIFLSSHILPEVEALCDRIGIINHGKIITVDRIDTLSKRLTASRNRHIVVTFENISERAIKEIKALSGVISVNHIQNRLEIETEVGKNMIPSINKILVNENVNITSLISKEADLEDVFLSLVGGK